MRRHLVNCLKETEPSLEYGGKANSIIKFSTKLNWKVPQTSILKTSAFDLFKETNKLKSFCEAMECTENLKPEDLRKYFQDLKISYEVANLPDEINNELNNFLANSKEGLFAIRSSANCEDGVGKAWAGQFNTYLNTPKTKVKENIKKCWASIFSPGVFYYAIKNLKKSDGIHMAVIIQEMIPADISGVCFTMNPINKNKNEVIIEACRGLGETLVSGTIVPQTYIIEKETNSVLSFSKGRQNKILKCGEGNLLENWENTEKSEPLLSERHLSKLLTAAKDLEELYGVPQDFEWAIYNDTLFLLQSRPITTVI